MAFPLFLSLFQLLLITSPTLIPFAYANESHRKLSLSSSTLNFPKAQAERLIRQLNLFPELEINISPGHPGNLSGSRIVEKQFSFSCLGDSGATVEDLGHHAGYYKLQHSKDARMFYLFFESRKSKSDPVVIWLTGGPGCSSELALFYENGPFKIANNLSLIWNDYGWDKLSKERSLSRPSEFCPIEIYPQPYTIYGTGNTISGSKAMSGNGIFTYQTLMVDPSLQIVANMIFVDQPIGTGFSYSSDKSDIRHNEEEVSNDLYDFIQAFFEEHPQYAKNDFYITGESYAGHYIPAFASRIQRGNKDKEGTGINLKGIAIGNGLTNPEIQYQAYTQYALDNKLITQADANTLSPLVSQCQQAIKSCGPDGGSSCRQAYTICNGLFNSILEIAGNINYYDIRKQCISNLCYDFSNMEKFLNEKSVRDALGVGDIEFVSCSGEVYQALITDWMRNLEVGVPAFLEDGVKVLVYAGECDLICNWLGNSRWVHAIEWSGQKDFEAAPDVPFVVDSVEAGLHKGHGPLSFLKVHDAGHMVPMDQPKASLVMIEKWMQGTLPVTGIADKLRTQ